MRTTVATWVLGVPYIIALLLFVFFSESGNAEASQANTLVWALYLATLTAGYAVSCFLLIDRDLSRRNLERDFISCFWPYFCVMGLIELEPRFRHAFDVLWAGRADGPLLIQTLALIFVPCFISFSALQAMMDPELGHVEFKWKEFLSNE